MSSNATTEAAITAPKSHSPYIYILSLRFPLMMMREWLVYYSVVNKRPLLLRTLEIERNLYLERVFDRHEPCLTPPATIAGGQPRQLQSGMGGELELLGKDMDMCIGPHRFRGISFWTTAASDSQQTARRSSLSLLQMYLAAETGRREQSNNGQTALTEPSCDMDGSTSPASSSIRDILSRNPGLVQLLNSACSKKPNLPTMPRSRPIFFQFSPTDVPAETLWDFPKMASIEAIVLHEPRDPSLNANVKGWPGEASLAMILRGVSDRLYQLLRLHTRDQAVMFAEHVGKGCPLANIAYKEVAYPCHPPCHLTGENLIKLTKTISMGDSALTGGRRASYPASSTSNKTSRSRGKSKNDFDTTNTKPDPGIIQTDGEVKKTGNRMRQANVRTNRNNTEMGHMSSVANQAHPSKTDPGLIRANYEIRKGTAFPSKDQRVDTATALPITVNGAVKKQNVHCANCATLLWRRGKEGTGTLCDTCKLKRSPNEPDEKTIVTSLHNGGTSFQDQRQLEGRGEDSKLGQRNPHQDGMRKDGGNLHYPIDGAIGEGLPSSSTPHLPITISAIPPRFAPIKKRRYMAASLQTGSHSSSKSSHVSLDDRGEEAS